MKKIIYAALIGFSLLAFNACTEEEQIAPKVQDLNGGGVGSTDRAA